MCCSFFLCTPWTTFNRLLFEHNKRKTSEFFCFSVYFLSYSIQDLTRRFLVRWLKRRKWCNADKNCIAFYECFRSGSSKKEEKDRKERKMKCMLHAMFLSINFNFLLVHINENSSLKIHNTEKSSIQYIIRIISIIISFSRKSSFLNFKFHMNKQRSNKLIFFILMLMPRHCFIFISITKIAFSFASLLFSQH